MTTTPSRQDALDHIAALNANTAALKAHTEAVKSQTAALTAATAKIFPGPPDAQGNPTWWTFDEHGNPKKVS